MNNINAHLPSFTQVRRSKLGLMLAMVGALAACHKDEPAPPPVPKTEEVSPPPPSTPAIESEPKPAATTARAAPVEPAKPATSAPAVSKGPSDEEIGQRVATFRAFHPYSTSAQLLRIPQFTSQLDSQLDAITRDPQLLDRVRKSAKTAGDNAPSYKLNLKVDNFTSTVADRLLGAVLSGEPSRLVDFVVNEADPANIQFVLQPGTSPK